MGTLHQMVDSRESEQTKRFRWGTRLGGFVVKDTQTGGIVDMGDGSKLFCDTDGEDCLIVGTQRFYDALNGYFENEQTTIASEYFGWTIGEVEANHG